MRHVKKTIVMKTLMHFITNINYMAYVSDCLSEICNTRTITFGYKTHFLSQLTFKLRLAWNAFDCLQRVKGSGLMLIKIGTRVAPVNIAFSSSRFPTLIERKTLQWTTSSKKLPYCTLNEIKTQIFASSDFPACVSIPCVAQKQQSNPDFLQNLLIIRCKHVLT